MPSLKPLMRVVQAASVAVSTMPTLILINKVEHLPSHCKVACQVRILAQWLSVLELLHIVSTPTNENLLDNCSRFYSPDVAHYSIKALDGTQSTDSNHAKSHIGHIFCHLTPTGKDVKSTAQLFTVNSTQP